MTQLNMATFAPRSYVNGPGARAVIWVQGCPIGCPGCFNPHTHSPEPRRLESIDTLVARIRSIEGIDGVTYSGGEPFAQAEALAELSRRVRAHGLTVMSYSGYTIERLRASRSPGVAELLTRLDILVDGPFVQAQQQHLRWRGSANQRVHFLTDRYRHLRPIIDREGQLVEASLSWGDRLSMTGFPSDGAEQELRDRLATTYGLRLLPSDISN